MGPKIMICLLTGANGQLGSELAKIGSKNGIEYLKIGGRNDVDITQEEKLQNFIVSRWSKVDYIVHCAAFTDVPAAETKRKEAVEANVVGTRNVAGLKDHLKSKILYVSTDYVYAGKVGGYKENDQTKPINFYAMTKLAGEAYLDEDDLIIRTSFKPSVWKYTSAFSDLYTSADYVDIIAEKITVLMTKRARGIFNVGTERKSIYELARRRNARVKPRSRLEVSVCLPSDVSMCTDKYDLFVAGENNVS